VARLNYNQFGATFGGPVILPKIYNGRNKTFFFINFEGNRTRSGGTGFGFVPTNEVKNGDFSAAGNPVIYDPSTFNATSRTRQPFPGNKIPSARINSLAPKVLSYYPSPNFSGQVGRNYAATIPGVDDSNNGNGRVDHRFSDKDSIFRPLLDSRPQPSTADHAELRRNHRCHPGTECRP